MCLARAIQNALGSTAAQTCSTSRVHQTTNALVLELVKAIAGSTQDLTGPAQDLGLDNATGRTEVSNLVEGSEAVAARTVDLQKLFQDAFDRATDSRPDASAVAAATQV